MEEYEMNEMNEQEEMNAQEEMDAQAAKNTEGETEQTENAASEKKDCVEKFLEEKLDAIGGFLVAKKDFINKYLGKVFTIEAGENGEWTFKYSADPKISAIVVLVLIVLVQNGKLKAAKRKLRR